MDSFLQQTARSLIETVEWKQLSRTTLVLPSHRAGLVLKDELLRLQQERHAQAVWAPQVLTLTQLQDTLSPLYAEDELLTIVRLYRHYCRLNADEEPMSLDLFYGWGRQMLADFTNIDASMPAGQVPAFFDNTIAAHELNQWQLDSETEARLRTLINPMAADSERSAASVKAQYERLWRGLYALYQALRSEMGAEQKGYAGMRQRAVIEHWDDESVQKQVEGRIFVFVGFNYLLPVERDLMSRLRDAGQARFYWDYVADFQTNGKAFSFAKLNSDILGRVLPPQEWTAAREVTAVACVSREAQAQYVHRWLSENYTARGQRVGVVICDETMLEPVIYTLPAVTLPGEDEPAPINITKGFPLRNTKIYAEALRWLTDRNRGEADQVVTTEMIDRMTAALFPLNESDSGQLSWQELLVLESEYQVRKIINQMRLLVAEGLNGVPFTLKLLRLLMRRVMESVTMPFHGEPVTDIQVMGVLETRMLDFDRLLLLNVEEGILPQRQADISFIPFYLRKAYHMQTSDERATVYAYNFFRLLSRAGHSTLLFTAADAAEGSKGMSRFIMQMMVSPEFRVQKMRLQEHSVVAANSLGIETQTTPRMSSLSPSALNTFITCPRSFYFRYVLGIKPQEEEDVLFSPNTLGSFVHHTIEYLYRTYLHCDNTHPVRVSPEQIEAIRTDETKLQAALDAAYTAMGEADQKEYIPAHHVGENVVILGYVNNILERDREDARVGLQIYLLEQARRFTVEVEGIGSVQVGGVIDRLDIYGPEGNEHLRIVDYKSGAYTDTTHAKKMSSSWDEIMESEEKGYVRQTLIYCHAVAANAHPELPIEPHLYFCRRKLADIETTVAVEGDTVHDYTTIKQPFYEALQAKIHQILTTTEFPQCEADKCPNYCPFFHLCGRKPNEY